MESKLLFVKVSLKLFDLSGYLLLGFALVFRHKLDLGFEGYIL